MTITTHKVGHRDWTFHGSPKLPLKLHGELPLVGWDIPQCWAIDSDNQCWADQAHGPLLHEITQEALIASATTERDYEAVNKIYAALGIPIPETCPHCGQKMP